MNRLQPVLDLWNDWAKAHDVIFRPGGNETDLWAIQLAQGVLVTSHKNLDGILKGNFWHTDEERQQALHDRLTLSALLFSMDTELKARVRFEADRKQRAQEEAQHGLSLTELGHLSIPQNPEPSSGSLTVIDQQAPMPDNVVPLHPPVPGTVSHLAGADVQFHSRLRQRCQWCAVALVDLDLSLIAWPEGSKPPSLYWPVGAWVRVVPGNPSVSSVIESEEGLAPEDSCMFTGVG